MTKDCDVILSIRGIPIVSQHFIRGLLFICGSVAYLSCPQRKAFVVQGLTTGGKCYHCNPHGRSCSLWPPPPPSHSEWWGTDPCHLRDDNKSLKHRFGLIICVFSCSDFISCLDLYLTELAFWPAKVNCRRYFSGSLVDMVSIYQQLLVGDFSQWQQ